MDVGRGHDGGAVVDGIDDGGGPIEIVGPSDRDHLGPGGLRSCQPGVDVGRELLLEDHDAIARSQPAVAKGGRHAVADGGDEGRSLGVAPDEPGEEGPQALAVGEEVVGRDQPRPGLVSYRRSAHFGDRPQLRRHVGAVEVGEPVGDVEEVALALDGQTRVYLRLCRLARRRFRYLCLLIFLRRFLTSEPMRSLRKLVP